MSNEESKEIIRYFEIEGEFEDDLGLGSEKEFKSTLKLQLNYGVDIELAKEYRKDDHDCKILRISIASELLNKKNQQRENGEQENIVELSLKDAELLRDNLDKMINQFK